MALNGAEQIIVLGAGLQGICAARVAARRGARVCLIDQDYACLERASFRNEGKIHLGHVYAHDPSFKTAELMLRSALSFAPLLDEWLPGAFSWLALRSNPFFYVIARETLAPKRQLFAHYARIEDRARELQASDSSLNYLGERLTRLWEVCEQFPAWLSPAFASDVVATPEVSIDTVAFRKILRQAVGREPQIEAKYGHVVEEVARKPYGFTVTGRTRTGETWRRDAGSVVNALWDGRLAIDAQLDLIPSRPWLYRFKHRVLARTPRDLAGLPSMTLVLGAFGDVVTQPRDESIYLSWYPVCQTGWSQDLAPPAEWSAAATGTLDIAEQEPIIRGTLEAFDHVIPGLGKADNAIADGGVIFAWGDTDIDDGESELHQRHQIGILDADGYFSINTGKLTSAPFIARELGDFL